MTKIKQKNIQKDMHSHIEKSYKIIDEYLPSIYVPKVQAILSTQQVKIGNSMIRNVKNRTNYNANIIKALVEVALEAKEQSDDLNKLINKF